MQISIKIPMQSHNNVFADREDKRRAFLMYCTLNINMCVRGRI